MPSLRKERARWLNLHLREQPRKGKAQERDCELSTEAHESEQRSSEILSMGRMEEAMSLTKSKGNMYDWCTHTHSHLRGKCSHACGYCYVQAMAKRFPAMAEKYSGEITLDREELEVNYGKGRTIFIEHMNDLFAAEVTADHIIEIMCHCRDYPDNRYVFQSKNPNRMRFFEDMLPSNSICGTTIESNFIHECMDKAPSPYQRAEGIDYMGRRDIETFITIEPILKFNVIDFALMIIRCNPSFVNIGADSKGHGLEEPTYDEVMDLYRRLIDAGIEVRKKINLGRLRKP